MSLVAVLKFSSNFKADLSPSVVSVATRPVLLHGLHVVNFGAEDSDEDLDGLIGPNFAVHL